MAYGPTTKRPKCRGKVKANLSSQLNNGSFKMTIELSKDTQEKVDAAKGQTETPKTETATVAATKPKTQNIKAKGQNVKVKSAFDFLVCSSGKIPGCNLTINGKVKAFIPGKKATIDIMALDKLPKQVARALVPVFKQYAKKYPLCVGHNYGGLQIGLNQNDSATWGNVLSYQDGTIFFTSSRVLPFGGVASIKAKMSKHGIPANRSGSTWAGWSINKAVPDSKEILASVKAILG